jgi:FtsH-binding integral membrane protein
MSLSKGIWERSSFGGDTMSPRAYIASVSFFTVFGLVLATVVGFLARTWHLSWLSLIAVGFVVPLIGILIFTKSQDWFISLFGYTIMVIGLGAIMGPCVATYKATAIMQAFAATAGTTIVTSVIGIIYPKSLEKWGTYLFGGLVALLLARIAQIIMIGIGMQSARGVWLWVEYPAALLFSLYIIYDWNRALRLNHTLDNAVDCAGAIFLDIINLFLKFLRIFGGSGSSSRK